MQTARFAKSRAGLFVFLLLYGLVLLALLPVLPLWLDEIYDLIVARMPTLGAVWDYVPHVSGNVPLSYTLQYFAVHWMADPAWGGRIPSALASLAACAGVWVTAKRTGLANPLLAAAAFALFPLQLRYALEARPYAVALALTVWATVALLRVVEKPSPMASLLYAVLVCAGLYTFPFTLFVAAAHLLYLVAARRDRALVWAGIAVGAAGLAFLPWYLHSAPLWKASVEAGRLKDTITWRAVPMILRELTGAGWVGIVLTVAAAAAGYRALRERRLWLLLALVPVLCVVAADMTFGYLLAIRQMIFVLPALAIFAAAGIETLRPRGVSYLLAAALVVTLIAGSVGFFSKPRENWKAAALTLTAEPCVLYAPEDSRQLYAFFNPELPAGSCDVAKAGHVALAVSPYPVLNPADELRGRLFDAGFQKQAELNAATPVVEIYRRVK